MPSVLTLTIFAYAVLIGLFGASLWAVAAVGGFAVLWQMASTLYAGVVPPGASPKAEVEETWTTPLHPEEDDLTDEERALLNDEDIGQGG